MTISSTRIALVTGASKGIGAGIARALADAGHAVVVNYRTDAAGADQVVQDIRSSGGAAIAVAADVSVAADVRALFATARRELGPVTVLVNNAGVATFAPLETITEADYRLQMDTNFWSAVQTTQALAAQDDIDGASIVNISTGGTYQHPAYASMYVATKAALEAFTVISAKELGPRGIRVNGIAPGPSDTDGTRAGGFVGSDMEAASIAATPLGRSGRPDDYGPVVAFLASEAAKWVTGDVLLVSGGQR